MAFVTQSNIVPGPCTNGCPEPTEIVCIEVNKVFDSCFQNHSVTRTFAVMITPPPSVTVGTIVSCALTPGASVTCQEIGTRTPVNNSGFFNVSIMAQVPLSLVIAGVTHNETLTFTKTVVLCAPAGTDVSCNVTLLSCNCVITAMTGANFEITCDTLLCVVVKAVADVNLLVPAFGFCVPAECTTGALGCPPMLPPQCTFPTI